jgi:hypothetical protein
LHSDGVLCLRIWNPEYAMKETQHSTLPEEEAAQYVCILVWVDGWVSGWVCISFILLTHESNASHTVTAILRELMTIMLLCSRSLLCSELATSRSRMLRICP